MARHTLTPSSPGQHHIQQDQIEERRTRTVEAVSAIADLIDRKPGEVEMQAQQLSNAHIVFDHENGPAYRFGHGVLLLGHASACIRLRSLATTGRGRRTLA